MYFLDIFHTQGLGRDTVQDLVHVLDQVLEKDLAIDVIVKNVLDHIQGQESVEADQDFGPNHSQNRDHQEHALAPVPDLKDIRSHEASPIILSHLVAKRN